MAACEAVKLEHFEVAVKHPAARVWKALVEQAHATTVAALPEQLEGAEVVEGTAGQAGSVWLVKLGSKSTLAQLGFTWAKVKYEEIDEAGLVATLSLVEGGALGNLWHSFTHTIKVAAAADASRPHHHHHAVVHHTLQFQRIGAHQFYQTYKDTAILATHSVEASLTAANPNVGCVSTTN